MHRKSIFQSKFDFSKCLPANFIQHFANEGATLVSCVTITLYGCHIIDYSNDWLSRRKVKGNLQSSKSTVAHTRNDPWKCTVTQLTMSDINSTTMDSTWCAHCTGCKSVTCQYLYHREQKSAWAVFSKTLRYHRP